MRQGVVGGGDDEADPLMAHGFLGGDLQAARGVEFAWAMPGAGHFQCIRDTFVSDGRDVILTSF